MTRAASTGVGLYFGLIQLCFTLSWVVYVIYLPKLAAHAGIDPRVVPWLLALDQAIFALCDWATGVAADRVAQIVGRLGKIVAAVTALSALAYLLLPYATGFGAAPFLALIIVWLITSSALRAPLLVLLGRYTPPDRQPWVGSLFLLGIGIASALAPFLGGWIATYDPRILFAASAVSVAVVTLSIVWAEKNLVRSAPVEEHVAGRFRPATLLRFLAAILLLAIGFQVHFFINTERLFLKFVPPTDLEHLLPIFWIGFSLLMLPASLLTERFGGIFVMALGALVAGVSTWAAAQATGVVWLGVAQFISGGAWGCIMMSGVAAALAIGRTGSEGKATGAMFSVMAVAAMARIVLVAGHFVQHSALATSLPWVPTFAWLGAGLMLVLVVRRSELPAQPIPG
ncbi:MFS transporter [Mycobacterium sp.]|uniref:MFS transporter n=1 Tax=Mycobacterium sp. TaxID=1785 RepID=UPI002D4F5073|nr:MFS transporter [Mycobacterium sp.]HZA10667.1 MFS transporter [Mycobacterium sp.]